MPPGRAARPPRRARTPVARSRSGGIAAGRPAAARVAAGWRPPPSSGGSAGPEGGSRARRPGRVRQPPGCATPAAGGRAGRPPGGFGPPAPRRRRGRRGRRSGPGPGAPRGSWLTRLQMRQEATKADHAVTEAGLGGPERDTELVGDLAVGQALEVGKLERLTLHRREPGDGRANLRAPNPEPRRLDHFLPFCFRGEVRNTLLAPAKRLLVPHGDHRLVVHGGKEVGGDTAPLRVESPGPLPNGEKGLLHHVLRQRSVVADLQGHPER